jgi:predicted nucleic acid-binding protein
VKILDTNLWVFGTLGTNSRAERLLDEIERGETISAINAYILQEALNAFDRTPGLSPRERDDLKTVFLTRLSRMTGLVEAPTSEEVHDDLLTERRAAAHTRLLARVLDVEAKDIPVLLLAFDHEHQEPTLLTNDESFASFRPGDHGLTGITVEYVE